MLITLTQETITKTLNPNENIIFYAPNYADAVSYSNGIKYEYKIADIYDVDKTGTVNISRDKNRTTITLITCKKYSKDKQTVFIGYLSNKEAY